MPAGHLAGNIGNVLEFLQDTGLHSRLDTATASVPKYATPFASGSPAAIRMRPFQPESSNPSSSRSMNQQCQHPRVQIVSRDEDAEFVECLDCREIFESSEFKDMAIEEKVDEEDE